MKKISYILLAMLFVFGSAVMCGATSISTSAAGSQFGDNYSYTFVITDDSSDSTLFHATLMNTSTGGLDPLVTYDPLIDEFAFNLTATLGTDFTIENIIPTDWLIGNSSGAIAFDYVGDEQPSGSDDRLRMGDALTFDFDFADSFTFPDDPFEVWTGTDESAGNGFGGGADLSGQVAVSFQRLNGASDESDHLASNWNGGHDDSIPEPATMLLLGSGLIGLAVTGKKKFKKRNG